MSRGPLCGLDGCDAMGGSDAVQTSWSFAAHGMTTALSIFASESILRDYAFAFDAFITAPCGEILEFFGSAARPCDDHVLNPVAFLQAECNRKLGLREVARTTLHHAGLAQASGKNTHGSADCIAV